MHTYEELREMVEAYLEAFFKVEDMPHARLIDAMRYSVMAGGKRLRPVLALAFCEAAGGDVESALPIACAAELLHTYSLIHDDLPCMDNDELRRGKPSCHIAFGEYTAVLAGDALQAEAFGMILRSKLPAEVRAECAETLADAAGMDGICGGQLLDMLGDGKQLTEDELSEIDSRKTASMFVAVCKMGAIAAGADKSALEAACLYGAATGIAFQIVDDVLDELSTNAALGKAVGSDAINGKTTFMSLYGRDKCMIKVTKLTELAIETLSAFEHPELLTELARDMALRAN